MISAVCLNIIQVDYLATMVPSILELFGGGYYQQKKVRMKQVSCTIMSLYSPILASFADAKLLDFFQLAVA